MYAGEADDYHFALLFTPNGMDRTTPRPFVFYFHGATATETQVLDGLPDSGATSLLNSWLDAGWCCMSFRLGTTVNEDGTDNNDGKWGNEPMRQGIVDALAWLDDNGFHQPAQGTLFFGFSAGGTNSVNALMEVVDAAGRAVAAVALVDPAVWLRNMYSPANFHLGPAPFGSTSAIHNQIKAAYSLLGTTVTDPTWAANVDGSDGGHDVCAVDLARIPFVPFYVSGSYADTTVQRESNMDNLVARLQSVGWGTSGFPDLFTFTYGGNHGASNHFRVADTLAFYERALGLV